MEIMIYLDLYDITSVFTCFFYIIIVFTVRNQLNIDLYIIIFTINIYITK